jgi:parvulin-like peptidyl-prolyl isomerase
MTARMWTLQSLASAAVLAVLAGEALAQAPAAPGKPAAIVNGQPITYEEVDAVLKLRPPMPTQPTEVQRRQMQMEALEFLIDERVMQQFMRKNGPAVDPKDVVKQLADLESGLKSQAKTMQDFYRETGLSDAQLRTNIGNRLQREGFVKARLTEANVKRYYEENREFFDQVTVQASHIVLRVPPTGTESERQAARAKLQAVRQEIVSGKIDFAEAAKKYSQCPSAPRGGDIGYFPRKWAVDEAFARVAFGLKVGEISDVVQTDYGFHLIKATDRKKEGPGSDFEKIKEEVRETAAQEMLETLLTNERKAAQIEIKMSGEQVQKGPQ